MTHYLSAALGRIGWWRVAALLLLWLGLVSVMLEAAVSVPRLDTLLLLGVLTVSLICGVVAAHTPLRPAKALSLLLLLGLAVTGISLRELWSRLVTVLAALSEFGPFARRIVDPLPLQRAVQDLTAAVQVVLYRLWEWGGTVLAGHYAYDPVALMLASGFTVWCVGAWAALSVFRRGQVAAALGPAAIVLAAILYGAQRYPSGLLVLLSTGLLLAVLNAHHAREQFWHTARIDYSEDIRLDLAVVVVPLTVGIVFATAVISSVSWQDLVTAAYSWLPRQSVVVVLSPTSGAGIGEAVPASAFENFRLAGLPRRHLIGSGPELSRQIVMNVYVSHAAQIDEPRFYWRSLTYDRYTGDGWVSGPVAASAYRAHNALNKTIPPFHFEMEQDISLASAGDGMLYASGIVQSVGSDVQLAYRADADLFGGLTDSRAYSVLSFHPWASEAALRAAGADYPEWIRDRYLALPGDVPERVLSLAKNLTAVEATPYDRARAIERYLRTLPYTLQLPPPPLNRDVVDYFLFDLQRGYCDYYASALVVLARAAGLPARLVVGYASGTFDADRARYVVTAADAHSWAEVYFPGIGWIEFEPTAGRPELERSPNAPLPAHNEPAARAGLTTLSLEAIAAGTLAIAGGGLLLVAVVGVAAVGLSDWRLRNMPPAVAVDVIYRRMLTHAVGVGSRPRPSDTAHEIVWGLVCELARLARPSGSFERSDIAEQFCYLADVYERALYSNSGIDESTRSDVIATWQRVRPILWKARWEQLKTRFKRPSDGRS